MTGPATILERDAEHAALDALAQAAAAGEGGVLLVEGPAGIGKTALLRGARAVAATHGLAALTATASPLDREFPFGLVHQLFGALVGGADAAARERLLSGAAGRARPVLLGEDLPADGTASHALLHGLYWLCANLAEAEPLLLLVDDLHWADAPSLRFLEFLGRRLDGLGVAVVAGSRTGEPGADRALLGALGAGPAARVLPLAPLSEEAVRALLGELLPAAPAPAFVAACAAATGGNPLLLRELGRAAAEAGLAGADADAPAVPALGSAGVAAAVERRLATLGDDARSVARAAAVAGDRGGLDLLAALAGLEPLAAAEAADALAGADILEPGGRAFVHPLVREAVVAALSAADRSRLHAAAARLLRERAAPAPEIAAHLLATIPAADPGTVALLHDAARTAVAEGALATAVAYLRRALDEPPAPADRAGLLLELGELEAEHGVAEAPDRLDAALAAGLQGDEAVRARAARARYAILRDPRAAIADLELAVGDARDPDLRLRLESLLLDVTAYQPGFDDRRTALLDAGRAADDPSPVLLAHLAQHAAYRSAPAAEVVGHARRALAGGGLLQAAGQPTATYHLLVMALRHAEQPALADEALRAGEAAIRRRGSRYAQYFMDHARAYWELMFGSVTVAEAHARSALAITEEARLPLGRMALVAMLAEVLVERGAVDEAEAHIDSIALTPDTERVITGSDLLGVRSDVHRLRRRLDAAEADARRARELVQARGWTTPMKSLTAPRLAQVLLETGRRAEALAVLAEDEAAAARAQTPGIAAALARVRGRALGGEEGIAVLQDAVGTLAGTAMALEHAWALHDLGALQRRAGRTTAAREPLRQALDEATRIGAGRLAGLAREELLAAGARPRREALKGPESLTPSERRVADLAITGLSNREIAETLWVSRKTVELHLGQAYGKLGIRSRRQLADALGVDPAAAAALTAAPSS